MSCRDERNGVVLGGPGGSHAQRLPAEVNPAFALGYLLFAIRRASGEAYGAAFLLDTTLQIWKAFSA